MNAYQFEKISGRMEKTYGKIQKGQEGGYEGILFAIESNLLKQHRAHPDWNARIAREGMLLALHTIHDRLNGAQPDCAAFETEANLCYRDAALMAVDPLTNEELYQVLRENNLFDKEDSSGWPAYYRIPIKCLLRVLTSMEMWNKQMGSNGYFAFLEDQMGDMVKNDGMKYAARKPVS